MSSAIQKIRDWQSCLLDGIVRGNAHIGLDARAEEFVRLFENYLPQKSSVLDIGGRWGFYARPLVNRGHHVTVLDVVKPGLQKVPVVMYDGDRIPFPDHSFDVSLLITVLHHIPDIEHVIREAHRVTRKRLIVVEDIYHHALGRFWTEWRDRIYNLEFFGHPCNFKKADEWVNFFRTHGFQLEHQSEVYTWLCGMRILNGIFVCLKEEL
ncbi:MAG: class I SAM-dependent methyltransferase [Candidatus Omnitrophota bacterium]|nr:class I SAM-dependent methyltransferase [Candidatus Omnitrophota bacterium]